MSVSAAEHALRQAGHDLPAALVMLKSGTSVRSAKRALSNSGGNVRHAIESLRAARFKTQMQNKRVRGKYTWTLQNPRRTKARRQSADQRRKERGSSRDGRRAPHDRARSPEKYSRTCATSSPWPSFSLTCAAASKARDLRRASLSIQAEDCLSRRSSVRTRENDARIRAHSRATRRAFRICSCVASRRLRHRRAPHRFTYSGARKTGRGNVGRPRLRGSARQAPARRQFRFPKITVTGTENILTAAVLAEGETVLENCALEPEVTDLVDLLIKMGAKIEGTGTATSASRASKNCTAQRTP